MSLDMYDPKQSEPQRLSAKSASTGRRDTTFLLAREYRRCNGVTDSISLSAGMKNCANILTCQDPGIAATQLKACVVFGQSLITI